MTDQELTELLTKSKTSSDLIPGLIEYVFRLNREIKALKDQMERQQTKPAKKSGRAKQDFYVDGILLTDEEIAYYVEGDYFTITQLERLVGAKKNQLRNRYKRYKEKQKLTKEESDHGNC
ncbi:MAG: hypothetical protein IKC46_08830 [Lachnospiraceae bacterium]|nr:hypothetical protein [Lachnospiraceae bacterium]